MDLTQPLWVQYAIIVATLAFNDLVVMAGYTARAVRTWRYRKSPRHVRFLLHR